MTDLEVVTVKEQDFAALQVRVADLETALAFALAQLDGIAAMRASHSELESRLERLEHQKRRLPSSRPMRWRLRVLLVIGAAALLSALVLPRRAAIIAALTPAINTKAPTVKGLQAQDTLTITAQGETWLEVQTGDGEVLQSGILAAGSYQLPFNQQLKLRAGRPDLVTVDYEAKSAALGAIDATGWHTFTPQ